MTHAGGVLFLSAYPSKPDSGRICGFGPEMGIFSKKLPLFSIGYCHISTYEPAETAPKEMRLPAVDKTVTMT